MKAADIISVNPAQKTKGALYHDTGNPVSAPNHALETAARTFCPNCNGNILDLDAMLPCSAPGNAAFWRYNLIFRTLFAAVIISSGCMLLNGSAIGPSGPIPSGVFAAFEIIAGISLVLGLFTRLSMSVVTFLFMTATVESMTRGVFDIQASLLLLFCAWFLCMGSGKFSCDAFIKRQLKRRAVNRRRRMREDRLSYKAMFCD